MNRRGLFFGAALLTALAIAIAIAIASSGGDVDRAEWETAVAPAPPAAREMSSGAVPRTRGLFYAGTGTGAAGLALVVGGVATRGEQSLEDCKMLAKAGVLVGAGDCAIVGMGAAMNSTTKDLVSVGGGAVLAIGATMALVGVWQPPARATADADSPKAHPRPAAVARIIF